MSRMMKTTRNVYPVPHISRSLYATNFIVPVSDHSLTVSYLPVLVTLQPLYFPSLAERRRCGLLQGSQRHQPLLCYVQVAVPSVNCFFIVLDSNSFQFTTEFLMNVTKRRVNENAFITYHLNHSFL